MLWDNYVLRSGDEAHELWDDLYSDGSTSLLYIAGRGFDTRGCTVLETFLDNIRSTNGTISSAELILVDFAEYELDSELVKLTEENERRIRETFSTVGTSDPRMVNVGRTGAGEHDINSTIALREGAKELVSHVGKQTDIVLDISSLPRVVYLSLMAAILRKLLNGFESPDELVAGGRNFQILVAEDTVLDSQIRSSEPSQEIVYVPGYSSAFHAESMTGWPAVWLPILGENRLPQFDYVKHEVDSTTLEVCPVLPHPSRNFRRGDQLLKEFRKPLFDDKLFTPSSNILFAHESNPFEAYRQIYQAIERYCESMAILDGCRIAVTPFSSKLITLGAGLACLEKHMNYTAIGANNIVSIPYAEPTRYHVSPEAVVEATPDITSLLLTGSAYRVVTEDWET